MIYHLTIQFTQELKMGCIQISGPETEDRCNTGSVENVVGMSLGPQDALMAIVQKPRDNILSKLILKYNAGANPNIGPWVA